MEIPRMDKGHCLVSCPYIWQSDYNRSAHCNWLKKELNYYDGILTEPVCYSLVWGQSVLEAHQVKGNAP
jgi:hypothetical protein